ncbi:MAG: UDP-N-acetylglucosamine 2-epimerase (non-hydrolyzing) [Chitinispirillales bacterium]|jgi:UDP-N-acetylglucosamine 2-epimerase (non-hydrolysing)|nr:UDP-N-acetylglucosamine 2-epimerase (non-hydrolyzing) [Chitinispirillales bacterium]
MKKILFVFGTRPEAVKMAVPILELRKRKNVELKICVSGQHRELLDGVLDVFEIKPDFDLNIMKQGQDLSDISSAVILGLRGVFKQFDADVVVVHGDTTTAFVSALAAYYQKIKVAHIEAGLRTGNIYSPFPEEGNRIMIDAISSFLFAPTKHSEKALLSENIDKSKIFVTGNSVVDALFEIRSRINSNENLRKTVLENIKKAGYSFNDSRKIVLITTHRRENIGENLIEIYNAIKILAHSNTDCDFLVILHPNPALARIIEPIILHTENIKILRDVDYYSFMFLMSKAYIIMTDSGGIQEEAPSFGVPVFVLRNETERPEGVECGVIKILGTNKNFIVSQTSQIFKNTQIRNSMVCKENPYGDGKASQRIADVLCG